MRDRASDEKAGKITLAVKLGDEKAKNYHYFLILGAVLCLVIYSVLAGSEWNDFIYLIGFIPLLLHLRRVVQNANPMLLDPELKVLALTTFLIALLFGVGLLI